MFKKQSTNINSELNKNKDFSTQEKANLESSKQELDFKLHAQAKELKEIESKIKGKKDEYRHYINEILKLYKRLQDRNDISKIVAKLVKFSLNYTETSLRSN